MKYLFQLILSSIIVSFACYSQDVREVKKTVDLTGDGKVLIDTYKGSITIETWDKPQVDIVARIEPDGWDSEEKDNVERTQIEIDPSPGEVRIKSDYSRLRKHRSWFSGWFEDGGMTLPFVHYKISMPKNARLSIKDYKSDSRISNLRSSINLETYKGTVEIEGLDGSIDLETYKGDVRIDMAKLTKDSRVETQKGKIQISLPRNAAFEIDTDLGRRARLESDFDAVYHARRHSDDIEHGKVNGGGPMLRLSSEKGTIRLRAL